jgi:hypothetical protein
LLSVQLSVAAVGEVVGLLAVQPLSTNPGGVGGGLTTRLMPWLAALPLFGVAVSVPL